MNRIIISLAAAAMLLISLTATVPAEATMDHTYVSEKGTDTGGCATPPTACRTFAYAITQTAASGEIIAIDPANYAPVTITQAISIVADAGGPAGIIVPTGNAITINAGPSDVVNLRGLTLDGEGTASLGVLLNSAGSLTVSDCFVRHFSGAGIELLALPPTTKLNASILNSVMTNNGTGLYIAPVIGTIGAAFVTVRNSVANYNGTGFFQNGGTLTLADSMATGNQVGIGTNIQYHPVTTFTYGDNELSGNVVNFGIETMLTPVGKQ